MSANRQLHLPPARLAAVAFAIAIACLLAVAVCLTVFVSWPGTGFAPAIWFTGLFSLVIVTFGGVGVIVAYRVPRNLLGWLLATIGLAAGVSLAGGVYSSYDRAIAHGGMPGATFITWIGQWAFTPAVIAAVVFVPLLFPNGRLPSPRWRPFAAFGVAAITAVALESAFGPWSVDQFPGIPNPYQVHGLLADVISVAVFVANASGPPALLIVLGSLVLRFRRSRGVERQQFKWFAYAGVLAVALEAASNLLNGPLSDALFLASILCVNLLPVAIGIAILRYRLFDIDLVINRTLVYGSLTAVLALVYVATVLALETVLSPLTRTSSLAVAASTLLVAALFQPVRVRVQRLVDRRFYRRRYDASREIAGFGSRLRDEVEPGRLTASIATTLERTVQPAFASIWLRDGGDR